MNNKVTYRELEKYNENNLRTNLNLVRIYLEDYLVYPQKLYLTDKDNKQCIKLLYNERKYFFETNTYNFNVVECVLCFLEQIEEREGRLYLADDYKRDSLIQFEESVKERLFDKLNSYLFENLNRYEKEIYNSLKFDFLEQFGESEEIPKTFIREWLDVQPIDELTNINYLFDEYILNA